MDMIQWDDRFLVGISEIDRQHRDFIKLINRLLIINGTGASEVLAKRMLMELVKYAEYHFISEENIMLILQYEGMDAQHLEHQRIIGVLNGKVSGYLRQTETLEGLLGYLVEWFITHTTTEDRKIGLHAVNRKQVGADIEPVINPALP